MNLTDVFAEYGDDAEAALAAYANLDPRAWSHFVDTAAEATYRRRYGAWLRSQKVLVRTEKDQPNLFGNVGGKAVKLRATVVERAEGKRAEHDITALAGDDGAKILRSVANRDSAPAKTALVHANMLLTLADEVERRSALEGRPVSVAEVLGIAA